MIKVGITLGDPTGISPEILLKSLSSLPKAVYIIYGTESILKETSDTLSLEYKINKIASFEEIKKEGFYLKEVYKGNFTPGKPDKNSAEASIKYLKEAVKDILNDKINGLVTLPISKEYVIEAGFKSAGHTDFLAEASNTKNYLMMLMCEKMKVALATTHIPLEEVPRKITKKLIELKLRLLHRELIEKFKIKSPKIAVVGLNPHAGDGGKIGTEEIEIIKPVIEKLNKEGFNLIGPLPPDTCFVRYSDYDAFFSMYHDQGLIPLKLLCFKKAVNVTLGLPFVRTSPDHGTGFDIAGKGIADPTSFIEAVKLLIKLTKQY
ncbi:4-hydroxythreonine-4-phosphate dehydrogenase PdxA [Persephonella sp.]